MPDSAVQTWKKFASEPAMRNARKHDGAAPLSKNFDPEAESPSLFAFESQAFFCLLFLFFFFYGIYPAALATAKPLSPLALLALTLFPPALCKLAALLLLPLPMPGEERPTIREKWAFHPEGGFHALRTGLFFLAMYVCVLATNLAVSGLCKRMGVPLPEQPLVELARSLPWSGLALIAVSSVLLAPLVEELTFRLVLFRLISRALPSGAAAVLASAAFAAVHMNLKVFPPLFVMGLFLQAAFLKSRSILPPILMHAAYNLISVLTIGAMK